MQPDLVLTPIKQIPIDSKQLQVSIEKNNCKNKQIIKQPVKNTTKNTGTTTDTIKSSHKPYCCCYNKEISNDMRCCGLCYTFCYIPNKDKQCYACPETFEIYYNSGYVITTCGYGKTDDECDDCVPTTVCLLTKLPLFFPCLLGSIFNNIINKCRGTEHNYLF